jgi:hypothetical protein
MNRRLVNVVRNLSAAAAALAVAALPVSPSRAAAISVVVLEDGPAPGIPGATFAALTDPRGTLNKFGQVAFGADLTIGSGVLTELVTPGNDQVIYRYSFGSGAELIARGGAPIPVASSLIYDSNSPRYTGRGSMNDNGEIVFFAGAERGPSALFVNGTNVVRLVGQPAPGLPSGVNVVNINVGALNDARINSPLPGLPAEALYTVQVGGSGVSGSNNTVLYRGSTPVAREGDVAPGTSDSFGNFLSVDNARINAAGQVAFTHDLATGGGASNGVVYRHTPGSGLTLLARDAAPAPGTSGEFFSGAGFFSPRINSGGQVAYLGELSNGDNVLYVDTALVARDGAAAPGLTGLTLEGVGGALTGGRVELNDAGTVLFVSRLEGPGVTATNDSALYLGSNPIARTGAASPIGGATFAAFSVGDLALNDLGQFALVAQLSGGGISILNDRALLFWDGSGWHVLAREGDPLAGSLIAVLVGSDGNPRIELNDAGQVLFWANLANGRDGLFLTAPIPEPAMVWSFLAGLAMLGLHAARKRRMHPA